MFADFTRCLIICFKILINPLISLTFIKFSTEKMGFQQVLHKFYSKPQKFQADLRILLVVSRPICGFYSLFQGQFADFTRCFVFQ